MDLYSDEYLQYLISRANFIADTLSFIAANKNQETYEVAITTFYSERVKVLSEIAFLEDYLRNTKK